MEIESKSGIDERLSVADRNVGVGLAADDATRDGTESGERLGEYEVGGRLEPVLLQHRDGDSGVPVISYASDLCQLKMGHKW